jgi:hypothetical protein
MTISTQNFSILQTPELWTHEVDLGFDAVFVEKKYFKWNDVKKYDNIARKNGTNQGKVEELADFIIQNGIDSNLPPVVIDYDTNEILTGGHRKDACRKDLLDCEGWMGVFVKCHDEFHRQQLCFRLNNHQSNYIQTGNDTESLFLFLINNIEHFKTEDEIKDKIKELSNNCMTRKTQKVLLDKVTAHINNKGITGVKLSRYTSHSVATVDDFLEQSKKSEDSYCKEVIYSLDPKSSSMYYNFGSGTSPWSILVKAAKVPFGGHLNIYGSTLVPSNNQTLAQKRESGNKLVSEEVASVVDQLVEYKYGKAGQIGMGHYPWQHPDCVHAWMAQDCENEDVKGGQFITYKL